MEIQSRIRELLARMAVVDSQQKDPKTSHSDQQLLDQEWDALNEEIEELEEMMNPATWNDWRDAAMYLEEPDDRGCPCCTNEKCVDCGQSGHMNHGTRCGASVALCDICVDNEEEDSRGCGNCAGCAYCMVDGGYDQANEV
jgi:hypothetical protein